MELYLDKYTLNLIRLKSEDEKTREFIQQIYQDMVGIYRDYCQGQYRSISGNNHVVDMDRLMTSYFNTLFYNGYLMDVRDIKLEEVLKK